jgi:hypothetical protein
MVSEIAPIVRNMMFTAMAQHVKAVKENTEFANFYQQRKQELILKVWQLVGPLLSGNDATAFEELGKLVGEAFTLSLDMNATPMEMRFHFPETNEAFDPATMINLDPWLNSDSYASVRGSAADKNKVKLGITPITRIGDNSVTPSRVRLVHLARVLLRIPNNKEHRTVFVETSPKKPGHQRLPIRGLFDNHNGTGDKKA